MEGRFAMHILVWDVISLTVASPALFKASESPGPGWTYARALARTSLSTGRDPSAFGSSESLSAGLTRPAPTATDAKAVQPGPARMAGQSITEGGWV